MNLNNTLIQGQSNLALGISANWGIPNFQIFPSRGKPGPLSNQGPLIQWARWARAQGPRAPEGPRATIV